MKVTVNDCLGLEAFSPSILAAGKRNIGNRVRSVSVMDASNVETALKNNGVREQIVLTSFYGMTGREKLQCEVVKGLAKAGVSALVVFHVEKGLTGADGEVIETAEQVGLPLIVIPKNNKAE